MTETFKIKKIEITVNYNDMLYDHEDIVDLLKYGIKSRENLFEITSEITIVNYWDVYDKIKK